MTSSPSLAQDIPDVVRTSGNSMAPLIRDRSLVTCGKASADGLAPGDIIVFRREGRLIAHRLIGRRGRGSETELREKGDNTLRGFWIPGTALAGKAVELRHADTRRSLEANARDMRLRCITRWSQFEADMVDKYLALKARRSAFRLLKWALLPAAFVAVPLRRLFYSLLLGVYQRRAAMNSSCAMCVVLECFRSVVRRGPHAETPLPAAEDWGAVLDMAGSLGFLAGLTRLQETGACGMAIPPQALQQVRKTAYRAALNHDVAMKALSAVHRELAAVTPYAVLKGPYLYESLYRNLYPREYDDIDILVPRQSVGAAMTALRSAGYEPAGGRLSRAFLRAGHFHLAFDSGVGGWPRIELHWSLVDRANLFRIPDAECFARLGAFRAGDLEFGVLAPEDQFIYLCLHAGKHGVVNYLGLLRGYPAAWFCRPGAGNRLTWFADIGLFLKKNMTALDWPTLRERAGRWNVTDEVAECLRVLQTLAPDSPADEALARMGIGAAPIRVVRPAAPETAARHLDWAMRTNPVLLVRPIRLLLSGRLFFPSPGRLRSYHAVRHAWLLPWFYLRHPFHMAAKLVGLVPPPSARQM